MEKGELTHSSGDHKPGEEIPYGIARSGYNGCYGVVLCQPDCHHTIECEVEQRKVNEKEIPEEFMCCPLESDHRIHYYRIYARLNQCVRDLNCDLQVRKQLMGPAVVASKLQYISGSREKLSLSMHQRSKARRSTCPNAYGKAEYIPAALSR
jgi:hypothetical protein